MKNFVDSNFVSPGDFVWSTRRPRFLECILVLWCCGRLAALADQPQGLMILAFFQRHPIRVVTEEQLYIVIE